MMRDGDLWLHTERMVVRNDMTSSNIGDSWRTRYTKAFFAFESLLLRRKVLGSNLCYIPCLEFCSSGEWRWANDVA